MKKIIYEYEEAISKVKVTGEINVSCFCPGVVNAHRKSIMRLGKISKWEYWRE